MKKNLSIILLLKWPLFEPTMFIVQLSMYFVMYNSVVLSKILKIVVPLEQNFEKTDFYSIKLIILIIIDIDKGVKWHNDFQYFG